MTTIELEYWTETFIKENLNASLITKNTTVETHVTYRILKAGNIYECLAFTTGEFQVTSVYLSVKTSYNNNKRKYLCTEFQSFIRKSKIERLSL